jgi:CO/xanthine dehydrogenase FAD-binding subunit
VRSISFCRAASIEEACDRKAAGGARAWFVAGGTDAIVALRDGSPSLDAVTIIDISGIAALGGIEREGDAVRIGPLVTHAEVERSVSLRMTATLLVEASTEVGSPQIRNRGTIGGNIMNASSCADTAPPLVALGAELTLRSVRGERRLLLEEALLAPYRTALADDELLTDIRFPALPAGTGSAFVKLGRRNALSISRMSVAAIAGRGEGERLAGVRIAAGSVVPVVRRFREVEARLEGFTPVPERLEEAGRAMAEEMVRLAGRRWSTPYKEPVVAALLRRAVQRAVGR